MAGESEFISTVSGAAGAAVAVLAFVGGIIAWVWHAFTKIWRGDQDRVAIRADLALLKTEVKASALENLSAHAALAVRHETLAAAHQATRDKLADLATRDEMARRFDRIDLRLDDAISGRTARPHQD